MTTIPVRMQSDASATSAVAFSLIKIDEPAWALHDYAIRALDNPVWMLGNGFISLIRT